MNDEVAINPGMIADGSVSSGVFLQTKDVSIDFGAVDTVSLIGNGDTVTFDSQKVFVRLLELFERCGVDE